MKSVTGSGTVQFVSMITCWELRLYQSTLFPASFEIKTLQKCSVPGTHKIKRVVVSSYRRCNRFQQEITVTSPADMN